MKAKKRDTKFEILRLIVMFGIVLDHYFCYGGVQYYGNSYNRLISAVVAILGGKTGNLIFIMISSWFCIEKDKLVPVNSGIIRLVVKCALFSECGYILACLVGNEAFNAYTSLKAVLWMNCNYGFITNYILLMIVAPVLNIFLKSADRYTAGTTALALIIFTLVLNPIYTLPYVCINIGVYLLIGYIKMYLDDIISQRYAFLVLSVDVVIIILIQTVSHLLGKENLMFLIDSEFDIPVIVNSLCIFLFVAKMKCFNSKIVNYASAGVVSIYLFHENIWIRQFIWRSMKCELYYDSPFMIVHCLLCCLAVMVIGLLIGLLYDFMEAGLRRILFFKSERKVSNSLSKILLGIEK